MEDRYAHLRVRNEHGSYDLTVEGWEEMARIHERLYAATREVAVALRKGRLSVDFKTAHREWKAVAGQMMELTGAGRLFDVGVRSRL